MRKAIYPGTFDPITLGHLDIIERAALLVDELHVVIADNFTKKPSFSREKRMEFVKRATQHVPNLVVTFTQDLVVRYAKLHQIDMIIRGLRNIQDYENEYMLYQFNRNIEQSVETVILFPSSRNHFVSSSAIKELIIHGAEIEQYVPIEIIHDVKEGILKQ
jgi:pantetheine-phosphate adenylyltransferase